MAKKKGKTKPRRLAVATKKKPSLQAQVDQLRNRMDEFQAEIAGKQDKPKGKPKALTSGFQGGGGQSGGGGYG